MGIRGGTLLARCSFVKFIGSSLRSIPHQWFFRNFFANETIDECAISANGAAKEQASAYQANINISLTGTVHNGVIGDFQRIYCLHRKRWNPSRP
jgi:hypothetical protein